MLKSGGAALVAAGLAAFLPPMACATYPGANGRIAYEFTSRTAPAARIHTIRPDGGGDRTLGVGVQPAWSANGRKIAFVRSVSGQSDIFVMNADGTKLRRVTATPRQGEALPYFAPGGRRLVFARVPSGGPSVIGSIRLDGSHYEQLADHGYAPQFSPDGRHIVYTTGNIWMMRRDGSHKRRLTDARPRANGYPTFRPDGRRILFLRFHDPHVIKLDGSSAPGPCIGATYSPDGSLIPFSQTFGQKPGGDPRFSKGSDIWVHSVDPLSCVGQQVTHYEQDPGRGYALNPQWQPLPSGS